MHALQAHPATCHTPAPASCGGGSTCCSPNHVPLAERQGFVPSRQLGGARTTHTPDCGPPDCRAEWSAAPPRHPPSHAADWFGPSALPQGSGCFPLRRPWALHLVAPGFTIQCDDVLIFRMHAKSCAERVTQRVVRLHACKESFARCMHAKSRLPAACAAAPQAAGPRRACNMQYACGIGYTAAYVYRILSRLYSCTDGCYYESRRLYSVL
jgi:hypothetical protein